MTDSPALSRRGLLMSSASALLARGAAAGYSTPHKLGRLVVAASGTPGAFDRVAVDSPFVFEHDGRFHMLFIGFDGTGYQTGLATSTNLVDWHKEGCVLPRDPNSPILKYNAALSWIIRDNDLRSTGRLKKFNGEYIGAYHAYPKPGYEQGPAVIGICRSKDLRHWKIEEPFLHAANGGAWERAGLYKPCLVEHDGTFHLFYNAVGEMSGGRREQTGTATSTDLKKWTRYEGNPILRNGGPGSPDEIFASDPCVLKDGDRWAMFYFGVDAKGAARDLMATSTDLVHTTKSGEVLVDVGAPGSIDSRYAHKPSLVTYKGDLYHFYCAVRKDGNGEQRGISVCRSRPW